ncbi:DUF1127 domain-containing protein [Mesorhizobium sp. M0276]|uniref:DUF1127 domain-containing protein n=1 Tax=Mesorhizobium sp. M0276 TaxID=2956928 RepID=UPI00333B6A0A
MTNIRASAPHRTAQLGTSVGPASRRLLTTLRSIITTLRERSWRERIRFRWQLRQMSNDNPYLIDDIGLTKREVEEEIAKPFWRP